MRGNYRSMDIWGVSYCKMLVAFAVGIKGWGMLLRHWFVVSVWLIVLVRGLDGLCMFLLYFLSLRLFLPGFLVIFLFLLMLVSFSLGSVDRTKGTFLVVLPGLFTCAHGVYFLFVRFFWGRKSSVGCICINNFFVQHCIFEAFFSFHPVYCNYRLHIFLPIIPFALLKLKNSYYILLFYWGYPVLL